MFAQGNIFCCAIGKGQIEGGLFVDGGRNRAHIRIVAEHAKKMRLPIFTYISIDSQANPS
jgi:hypothetical protein